MLILVQKYLVESGVSDEDGKMLDSIAIMTWICRSREMPTRSLAADVAGLVFVFASACSAVGQGNIATYTIYTRTSVSTSNIFSWLICPSPAPPATPTTSVQRLGHPSPSSPLPPAPKECNTVLKHMKFNLIYWTLWLKRTLPLKSAPSGVVPAHSCVKAPILESGRIGFCRCI